MTSKPTGLDQTILDEIERQGGDLSKVARGFGLNYFALRQRFDQRAQTMTTARGPEPDDIRSLGKPRMGKYVIAVKRAGEAWPEKYDKIIARARILFDNGTHEMAQANNQGWVVLYLIPRLVPTSRRYFFCTMGDFH